MKKAKITEKDIWFTSTQYPRKVYIFNQTLENKWKQNNWLKKCSYLVAAARTTSKTETSFITSKSKVKLNL